MSSQHGNRDGIVKERQGSVLQDRGECFRALQTAIAQSKIEQDEGKYNELIEEIIERQTFLDMPLMKRRRRNFSNV